MPVQFPPLASLPFDRFLIIFYHNGVYIVIIIFGIFVLLLGLWSISNIIAILGGSPPIHTSRTTCKEILKKSGISDKDILVDLGSGSGNMVVVATKEFGCQATGYELSPYPFLMSVFKTALTKRARVHYASLHEAKLSKATVIYIYLLPKMLERLESKLKKETLKGTKIITRGFPLTGFKPTKVLTLGKEKTKVFYYRKH